MHCTALVVAGGRGRRFGGPFPKAFAPLDDRPLVAFCLETLQRSSAIQSMVLVVPAGWQPQAEALAERLGLDKLRAIATGGDDRPASVRAGLDVLPEEAELVAVHDGVRPFVTQAQIEQVVLAAARCGAAIPALPVVDTVKHMDRDRVIGTLPRDGLVLAQTPQVFRVEILRAAHGLPVEGFAAPTTERTARSGTDDAELVERLGLPVAVVPGDPDNVKITVPEDRVRAMRSLDGSGGGLLVGQGLDQHPLVEGARLILGGVVVDSDRGLLGHSDGDALTHAIADALLGAATLGDLGTHFPDDNPAFKEASSLDLLRQVSSMVSEAGYRVSHVDATVVLAHPRLAPYVPAMRAHLAAALGLDAARVSVKAKSGNGLDAAGRGEGASAMAIAMLVPRRTGL